MARHVSNFILIVNKKDILGVSTATPKKILSLAFAAGVISTKDEVKVFPIEVFSETEQAIIDDILTKTNND